MAHNSLFAILLRSRWWISIALAALVTLVSTALLPKDIAPFAAITALPFFGIGCVAAWRQLRAPSPAKVEQALEIAAQQSWREFADRLDRAWQAEGYTVTRLPDKDGADFVLEREGRTTVASAKRWKAGVHGMEPLRALLAAGQARDAATVCYLSLQPPAENAAAWAKQQGIALISGQDLGSLLAKA